MSATDWSELNGYEGLVSELRANPPVAPERLRQRVLEGAPAPRRQRSRKRRLLLVVVPAAVVLAVGAALVHGFVSSGRNSQSRADAAAGTPTSKAVLGVVPNAIHGAVRRSSTTPESVQVKGKTGGPTSWNAATQSPESGYSLDQSKAAFASGGSAL